MTLSEFIAVSRRHRLIATATTIALMIALGVILPEIAVAMAAALQRRTNWPGTRCYALMGVAGGLICPHCGGQVITED